MRRTPAILFLLLAGCALPAFARLGETLTDCSRRYGRAFSVKESGGDVRGRYAKQGVAVDIVFAKGKAVEIVYRRVNRRPLSDQDVDLFLKVNASTSKWTRVDQVAEWKEANRGHEKEDVRQAELMRDLAAFFIWTRADGKAEATYDRAAGVLLICDSERLKKLDGKPEPADPEPPQGF